MVSCRQMKKAGIDVILFVTILKDTEKARVINVWLCYISHDY